jgi:signal transduction histidine kinase/CheY-like chemotaxis protein
MFRKMRLFTFNLINPMIIMVLLLFFWTFNVLQERGRSREQAEAFAREYSTSQKQLLSFTVANTIDFIKFKQSQIERRIKGDLQRRVDEAYRLAEKLYTANYTRMSDEEIQREILLTLESQRFNQGRGYYFVYTLAGGELLSSDRLNSKSSPSSEKRRVVEDIVQIAREQGQGFYTYQWPKPGYPLGNYPKISFVKRFEPYSWLIGTGEYVEDMKTEVQKEVIQWIDHLRISEVGYMWIHSSTLEMIVHPFYTKDAYPSWYQPGGLADFADSEGKRLFVEMTDCCLENGSGYIEYLWSKPNHSGDFKKTSYVELIKDWGWIVGAGVYIDDLERTINQNELAIKKKIRSQIIQLLVLAACCIPVLAGLTRFFQNRVRKAFATFSAHFQEAAHDRKEVVPECLSFKEFQSLAIYVNKMVADQRAALTQLKESEEQLMQAQKMEAVGRLAGGIAHDFGNLMMAVHGHTEMLLWNEDLSEQVRGGLQDIQQASERACSLTHKLLAFSRCQVLQPEVIDLNRLVSDLKGMLGRIIGEDIRLETDFAENLGSIEADPVQIEQIVINMALNARDAMPRGGTLRISTRDVDLEESVCGQDRVEKSANHVLMEIADTGMGMDTGTQEHLFEPFFTTKEIGKGTGLGLSTVYGIVKQSGGSILVSSERGRGTTFSMYFPRVEREAREQAISQEQPQTHSEGETILLVEDEAKVRHLIARSLRHAGYQVLEAGDGTEALNLLRHFQLMRIDLILTDMVMPGMGGDELALRLPPQYRDTAVLFMSGYPGKRNIGSRLYIQKPFSHQTLCNRIRELLDVCGVTPTEQDSP